MVRITGGPASRARHNKVRKATKGYRHKNHTTFKLAQQAHMKAGLHAYVGRKQKKRDFRRLWITRISAALRTMGLRYSEIKNKWLHAHMEIDRKNLSELAVNYPQVFEQVVEVAKKVK
ncbi:50S ribosomal protein L20 [Candidatus Gracilibacteria bacterium]|nr:50S ribosomal protein L20 [Candidatus Gracilibacteria bacterium]MCF7819235.1 50S ribosomal protein L20 [Candidatus Gracilibacteria bacterium]